MTQSDGAVGDNLHSACESLERSPERFRLIVESIRDYAIFMLDPTGHIVSWNTGAERIKGYKADEIIGKHFSIFYEPAEVAAGKCDRELELAARDGRFEDEGWRLRKDGSRFWASVIITTLHDPTGRLVGFAKVTRDLTERMLAERARMRLARAEEARRWLATTLRSIGDAVITTDARGNVTLMNAAAESLLGLRLDAVRGTKLGASLRIIDAGTREAIENPIDQVLRLGVMVSFGDAVVVRPDGRETPIADSAAPIREEGGEMEGVVVVIRDATAEKLGAARRAFMIDASAVLASSLDESRALSGLADLAVPRIADFCAIDIVDDDGRARRVATAGVAPVPPTPSDALRAGGSVMGPRGAWIGVPLTAATHVLGAITLAYGDSGRVYGPDDLRAAEELARHVTMALEKARLYHAEQSARQSADSANRAKDEFLAAVSHELRTPLTAILGWSKMITGASLDDFQRARAAETIERNAVAMTQLIEDLLDVSRIVSGKMRIDVKRVDLEETLDAALDSVRPALSAKGIHLEKAVDPHASEVRGDASRLQQVVWNLLSNAVKFTPPGGHVRVVLRAAGGATDLVVSDDGKGIEPQFMPHVFEAFRQGEGGIVRHAGGLGLGLAITKHIVELHGGTIDVQSDGPGKGTTFTVRLPSAAQHRTIETIQHQPLEPALEHEAQLDGLRVLMVDDEEDARDLVRAVLEHSGSIVTTASSVKNALEVFREDIPDVLLSDIGMPGESGYDLIKRVRELPPEHGGNVPAAALTAYARPEDRRKVLGAGFMMHVPKPVDPAELVAVVAALARISPARA